METVTKSFGGNDFYYLSLNSQFFHLSKDPSNEFEYSRNDAGGNLDDVPKVEEGESKKETKRPTCGTKFEYLFVDCKMCPHQTLPPEIPVCRPASPSPRASRGKCSTLSAETSPAFPREGTQVLSCNHFTYFNF